MSFKNQIIAQIDGYHELDEDLQDTVNSAIYDLESHVGWVTGEQETRDRELAIYDSEEVEDFTEEAEDFTTATGLGVCPYDGYPVDEDLTLVAAGDFEDLTGSGRCRY